MNRCAYMIVTEIGYFISHDTLRADINEAIEYFKSKYKFEKIIDIIKEPYLQLEDELEDIYNNDNISDYECEKLEDIVFDKYRDINKNRIDSVVMDSQM